MRTLYWFPVLIYFCCCFHVVSGQLGAQLYELNCEICHAKLEDDQELTAPKLGGIQNEVSKDWFIRYTQQPYEVTVEGDFRAICSWLSWKPYMMSDFKDSLTEAEIGAIYEYISLVSQENKLSYPYACDSTFVYHEQYRRDFITKVCDSLSLQNSTVIQYSYDTQELQDFYALHYKDLQFDISNAEDFDFIHFYFFHSRDNVLHYYNNREVVIKENQYNLKPYFANSGQNYVLIIAQKGFRVQAAIKIDVTNSNKKRLQLEINRNSAALLESLK